VEAQHVRQSRHNFGDTVVYPIVSTWSCGVQEVECRPSRPMVGCLRTAVGRASRQRARTMDCEIQAATITLEVRRKRWVYQITSCLPWDSQ
jgi:hypothetical protein